VSADRPATGPAHRYVVILEDDARRVGAMREQLDAILASHVVIVFDASHRMIAWLKDHVGETGLIPLDHDLPINLQRDYGCGRDVADYLASQPPTCPVIVHSSNDVGASGMYFELTRAGWPCKRIYPRDDLSWIRTAWHEHVRALKQQEWLGSEC
jgi:hypothetical protein